jgi:hypothetical protein
MGFYCLVDLGFPDLMHAWSGIFGGIHAHARS